MEFYAARWCLSVSWGWCNYVSIGGVLGAFNLNIKHLQVILMFDWKPRWPRRLFKEMAEVRFFDRMLGPENTRWTAMNMGIQFWPIILSGQWHATCHGCVEEYGRDHTAYQGRRYGVAA